MDPTTRRRSLTVSCLDTFRRRSPPSSPTPRPSHSNYQPPQFSLPPSSYGNSNKKFSTEESYDFLNPIDITQNNENSTQLDSILSSSAPSATLPLESLEKYKNYEKSDIYSCLGKSPSFVLTELEMTETHEPEKNFQDYNSSTATSNYNASQLPSDDELYVNDQRNFAKKFNCHYSFQDEKAVPISFRLNPGKETFNYINDNIRHESLSNLYDPLGPNEQSSDDEFYESFPNTKNSTKYSTSPILSYTLEKLKEKSSGIYESQEPPEFRLDVSFYD